MTTVWAWCILVLVYLIASFLVGKHLIDDYNVMDPLTQIWEGFKGVTKAIFCLAVGAFTLVLIIYCVTVILSNVCLIG